MGHDVLLQPTKVLPEDLQGNYYVTSIILILIYDVATQVKDYDRTTTEKK